MEVTSRNQKDGMKDQLATGARFFEHEPLRQDNKRLIMSSKNEGSSINKPYDEYATEHHIVPDGSGIVAEFNSMSGDKQEGTALTYLRCQTITSSNAIALGAAITFHNRVLLAQKANADSKTLNWLCTNAKPHFGDNHLLVILNDFFNLATSDIENQITKMRLWDP
ncbi:hypothetical protein TSTA_007400 [Talaromyces stipitatus ATCC 10500]|uniref:Uncharacterized protein n=1 Tax=Talaromyces stipitatus (strain ATCC 10500 / CBS 375.48 / QM 6759 / NRRL 1006) TaxID=441959 RepID=B8MVE1_TALSN|nr:uncharacterized protein TSTA_007400 [Talaromyces stipitatus ATCC 10500]EED11450.1 hypothetical protein TSTA_007400 [Talaromyces stipitatus ATCC 10500]